MSGVSTCLAGLKVLDLSQWLPGPFAAQILADLGADVLKVEPPAGDPARALGRLDGDGLSLFYKSWNAGKTVLRLDLKASEGQAAMRALVAKADVLLESFRPGTLARLGLGPDELRRVNPRLVHTALSGWGQTGPYAARAGHDINYLAVGGGLIAEGGGERPFFAIPPVADCASAQQAVIATLAALLRRSVSGEGGFVDVSLMESVLAWQGYHLTMTAAGEPPRRGAELLNGGAACYNVYRTADGGFVSLGAVEAKFWANFCTAVERPDWVGRQGEAMPQSDLIAEVAALFAERSRADWQTLLDPVDCCFEALLEMAEVAGHPQVESRGLLAEQGALVQALFPAILDGAGPQPRPPVEELGLARALARWGVGAAG